MECSAFRLSWIKLSCSATRIPAKRKLRIQANDSLAPSTNWEILTKKQCGYQTFRTFTNPWHQTALPKKISISRFFVENRCYPFPLQKTPPKITSKITSSEPLVQQVPPNPILRAPCSQRTPEKNQAFWLGKKKTCGKFLTTKSIHVLPGVFVFFLVFLLGVSGTPKKRKWCNKSQFLNITGTGQNPPCFGNFQQQGCCHNRMMLIDAL